MAPRQIAVAARELEGPPRGVARWLREVLDHWRETGRDRGVTLYMENGPPDGFDTGGYEIRITGSGPGSWVPKPQTLLRTNLAMHEYAGWAAYWLAGYL